MKKLLLIALFCITANADWFKVADLYVDAKMFTGSANDAITREIGRQLDKGLTLGMNIDFFSAMYFNNNVIGRTSCIDKQQCAFTSVAYDFQVGTHLFPWLDLEYAHRSSHALDHNFPFYVEDSIGIRINFIKSNKTDTILP